MTTGIVHSRNVAPWADLSTMQAHHLTALWARAGLELAVARLLAGPLDSPGQRSRAWWLSVRRATAGTHLDRWCIIE